MLSKEGLWRFGGQVESTYTQKVRFHSYVSELGAYTMYIRNHVQVSQWLLRQRGLKFTNVPRNKTEKPDTKNSPAELLILIQDRA